ncbi:uncharacterized protein LOC135335450 isoform X2 [Halichondria panicea]
MEQTFNKSSCSLPVNKRFDGDLHMTRDGTVNKKSETKWKMDRKRDRLVLVETGTSWFNSPHLRGNGKGVNAFRISQANAMKPKAMKGKQQPDYPPIVPKQAFGVDQQQKHTRPCSARLHTLAALPTGSFTVTKDNDNHQNTIEYPLTSESTDTIIPREHSEESEETSRRKMNASKYGEILIEYGYELLLMKSYYELLDKKHSQTLLAMNIAQKTNERVGNKQYLLDDLYDRVDNDQDMLDKLETSMAQRQRILDHIKNLQKHSEFNELPMEENPAAEGFHPRVFRFPHEIDDEEPSVTIDELTEAERQRESEEEKLKDEKRRENTEAYHRIFLFQREKKIQLTTLVDEMARKQASKQYRIEEMDRVKRDLTLKQKIHLRSLKNSSKKLEKKLAKKKNQLTYRVETMKKLVELKNESETNPDPMFTNPCLLDFEPTKDQAKNLQDTYADRPTTRSLRQRLNPKFVIAKLQKKFSKKPTNDRPLGAHHGRRTENMQDNNIPREIKDFHSDSEEEVRPAQTQDSQNNGLIHDQEPLKNQSSIESLVSVCSTFLDGIPGVSDWASGTPVSQPRELSESFEEPEYLPARLITVRPRRRDPAVDPFPEPISGAAQEKWLEKCVKEILQSETEPQKDCKITAKSTNLTANNSELAQKKQANRKPFKSTFFPLTNCDERMTELDQILEELRDTEPHMQATVMANKPKAKKSASEIKIEMDRLLDVESDLEFEQLLELL